METFHLNPGLDRALQPYLVDDLDRIAKGMATDASVLGRTLAYGPGPQHYADQIEGSAELVGGEARGQVVAAKFTSWWIEAGTQFMEGRHVLEQAARRSGLEYHRPRQRSGRGRRTNRATRGG